MRVGVRTGVGEKDLVVVGVGFDEGEVGQGG